MKAEETFNRHFEYDEVENVVYYKPEIKSLKAAIMAAMEDYHNAHPDTMEREGLINALEEANRDLKFELVVAADAIKKLEDERDELQNKYDHVFAACQERQKDCENAWKDVCSLTEENKYLRKELSGHHNQNPAQL